MKVSQFSCDFQSKNEIEFSWLQHKEELHSNNLRFSLTYFLHNSSTCSRKFQNIFIMMVIDLFWFSFFLRVVKICSDSESRMTGAAITISSLRCTPLHLTISLLFGASISITSLGLLRCQKQREKKI